MCESFPNPSKRDFVVLYAAGDGGLELCWRCRQLNPREAEAAFSAQPAKSYPSVRLRRFSEQNGQGETDGEVLPVASFLEGSLGFSCVRSDAWYQAELGVASHEGGWLMLARSNILAVPHPKRTLSMGELSGSLRDILTQTLTLGRSLGVNPFSAPAREEMQSPSPRGAANGESSWQATVAAERAGPSDTLSELGLFRIPRVGNGKEPPVVARYAEIQPVELDAPGYSPPRPGSGPVLSFASQQDMALWGELRVAGRAPPGTKLQLGGHDYQVGPGGRFAFDLNISDPELIHAILRLLPSLPVVKRGSE